MLDQNPRETSTLDITEVLPNEILFRIMLQLNLSTAINFGYMNRLLNALLYNLFSSDDFWESIVLPQQRMPGQNRKIFIDHLIGLEQKLGYKLFPIDLSKLVTDEELTNLDALKFDENFIFPETLTITNAFHIAELQQLVMLMPHLSFTKVHYPKLYTDQSNPITTSFVQILNALIYKPGERPRIKSVSLPYILPILPYYPGKKLAITSCENPEMNIYEDPAGMILIEQAYQLAKETGIRLQSIELIDAPNDCSKLLRCLSGLTMPHLRKITCSHARGTPAEMQALTNFLKIHQINKLRYEINRISSPYPFEDFRTLMNSLPDSLVSLTLSIGLSSENFRELMNSLPDSLITFSYACDLGDEHLPILASTLPRTKVEELKLMRTEFTTLKPLSDVINKTLITSLYLSFKDNISTIDISSLAKALSEPTAKLLKLRIKFVISDMNQISKIIPSNNSSLHKLYYRLTPIQWVCSNTNLLIASDETNLLMSDLCPPEAMYENFSIQKMGVECYNLNLGCYIQIVYDWSFSTILQLNSWLAEKREIYDEIINARPRECTQEIIQKLYELRKTLVADFADDAEKLGKICKWCVTYYKGLLERYNELEVEIVENIEKLMRPSVHETQSPRFFPPAPRLDLPETSVEEENSDSPIPSPK